MQIILRYLSLAMWIAMATPAFAQAAKLPEWTTDFANAQETDLDLGHGIHVLSTNIRPLAGNTTVAVGSDGLIVIDTQFPQLFNKLKAGIANVSKLPVRFVINTHHHGDHTGGNEGFGRDGAVIVSHSMVAQRLERPAKRGDGSTPAPMPAPGLPSITYDANGVAVRVGAQVARLFHPVVPAHSDSDTIVYFADANVIVTGDIFNSLLYPNIDASVGATIDGMIAAVDQIASMANDQTRIVPGHGPVSNKAGLAEYRAMLVVARTRIGKAKEDGMTEQQVMNAHLLDDLNARWFLTGSPVAERFPAIVYQSIK
jgi:glyoxylase-like metal-dependent hydrolase (beta-lactamase superfamily II)